jgi:hypothetical protein
MSKLNDMIRRAQTKAGGSRNLKSIVTELLYGEFWNETQADATLHRQVMRVGWDHYGAAFLKTATSVLEESGVFTGVRDEQLDLWPESARRLVQAIDRVGVFVPSAKQYLKLEPDSITPEQVEEAGHYLITHGQDSMRRGERLIELSGMPWGPTS